MLSMGCGRMKHEGPAARAMGGESEDMAWLSHPQKGGHLASMGKSLTFIG